MTWLTPQSAQAAWPHNTNNGNVALCTAPSDQSAPTIISDGAGGAIVTWYDGRSGGTDIYVQRVNAAGVPQWTANGVAVCAAAGDQYSPMLVSDGAGGAIVTWYDYRNISNTAVYAQRVNAAGVPQWTANGVAVSSGGNNESSPTIVSDGAGGAIITWYDFRNGNYDIFAQRVNAAGTPQWTASGLAVCTAANSQFSPTIAQDGAGGAIITWQDFRGGANYDIYAQRVNAAGVPQWAGNGVALSTTPGNQVAPTIVSDGAGGAIVSWYDNRNGNYDIYSQAVNAAGVAEWAVNGLAVCTAAVDQFNPVMVSDGAGGAIITWYDDRSGNYDIYCQEVNAAGVPQWTANGLALCTSTGDQESPSIISDGAGGAIVSWYDSRNLNNDIYAQRVNASGSALWNFNGTAISTALNNQDSPTITTDGAGGAIITWRDFRSGNADIYAQRIERFGNLGNPEPVVSSALDVPNDQGGKVKVVWTPSYLDADPTYGIASYWIWRSVPPNVMADALARGGEMLSPQRTAPSPGVRTFFTRQFGTQTYSWEYVGSQAARGFPSYSFVVPTTSDSVAASNPLTGFMVEANAEYSNGFWNSAPDSGYSVDNLPPAPPAPFVGTYGGGSASLHWGENSEPDLAGYRLYRGTTVGFIPSPANRVASPTDTTYTDAAGQPYYYKLSAVDIHGNESGFTTVLPLGALGVPQDGGATALALERPSPNPAIGPVTLRFMLPREMKTTLVIYDMAGRRVREVVAGVSAAGEHSIAWDRRDESGREAEAGIYYVRLEAESRSLTRRFTLLR